MYQSKLRSHISVILIFFTLLIPNTYADDSKPGVLVYKSPTCGCCSKWVRYLEDHGYKVETRDTTAMDQIKSNLGLTDNRLKSCHTAVIDGYIVEGHVPVADIKRLVAEKPQVKGITAPGMPLYSPGMESIEPKGYEVYSFDQKGNIKVYSRY